jgi:hypothetical protein
MRFLLDVGALRKAPLADLASANPEAEFIVPDTALVEMCKNENWEGTMRPSFRQLADIHHRCFVTRSLSEVMEQEWVSRKVATEADVLHAEFQPLFASVIRELDGHYVGPGRKYIRRHFVNVRDDMLKDDLHAEAALKRLTGLARPWVAGLKPYILSNLRNGSFGDPQRVAMLKVQCAYFFKDICIGRGFSEEEAEHFFSQRPLALRNLYAMARLSLHWAISGGLQMMKPTTALNHLLDQDYVVLGTVFNRFITLDGFAQEAYDELCALLEMQLDDAFAIYETVLAANPESSERKPG